MVNTVEAIAAEAKRIEEDALFSAKAHFENARSWTLRHFWIGIPATVLAALAAASALGDYKLLTAWMAAAATVLTALLTFLDPKQRATTHLNAGNSYKALNNNARIFRDVRAADLDPSEATTQLEELNEMRNKLNSESPQPSKRAHRRAKVMIEGGQAEYAVDRQSTSAH